MPKIKEARILSEIPLSLVNAGQIVQLKSGRTYLVVFSGKERYLIRVDLDNWIRYNIYDVEQPNIIRVLDNKAKAKCIYIKESTLEDKENEKSI